VAGIAHWSDFGPPETFSPSFSLLCSWIHGLFPAIEFVVVPSPSLPNSGDPGRPSSRLPQLRRPHAAERSSAARSHSTPSVWSPPSDSDRTARTAGTASHTRALRLGLPLVPSVRFRSHGPDRGYRFAHARPAPLACLSAPKSPSTGPARLVRPRLGR
jgi:hypothetical protein